MGNQDINFKDDIFSFYRFVTPLDMLGKIRFYESAGPAGGAAGSKKKLSLDTTERIMNFFVNKFTPGDKIVSAINGTTVKKEPGGPISPTLQEYNEKGYFKICTQKCEATVSEYGKNTNRAADTYFMQELLATDKKSIEKKSIGNFYVEVCGGKESPPVDFSMIMLRAPMLTSVRRNAQEIELYLNAMPPKFANELVPYCEVEFQLPMLKLSDDSDTTEYVNRPSLYRFLVGSGDQISNLTEADKSLAGYILPQNRKNLNLQNSTASDAEGRKKIEKELAKSKATFIGMEMFTTPQTLSNMDELKTKAGSRVVDVKPFLPPASIQSVSISLQNAGAGVFGKKNAGLTMVIHDKARLTQFAEFLRGQSGYGEATVWITYGMLAPRNRGENDVYAKFINENMLQRDAFVASNTQFTFNQDGSVTINLSLAAKGRQRLDFSTISFGGSVAATKNQLKRIVEFASNNAAAWGGDRDPKAGFGQSEIRFSSILNAAAAGDLDPGISQEDLGKIFTEVEASLQALKSTGRKSKLVPKLDVDTSLRLVAELKTLYLSPQPPQKGGKNTGGGPAPKERLKAAGTQFAQELLFKAANRRGNPDPFFPEVFKNKTKDGANLPNKIFTDDLLASCTIPKGNDKRRYVSLGKIFSLFCVQPILASIAEEFGWSRDMKKSGKESPEVQFIFYQLNRNCGPVSGHNIAEFPIDVTIFADNFGKFVEATGGDDLLLSEFLGFLTSQLEDFRQPGYGRKNFYKDYESAAKPEAEAAPAKVPENTSKEFNSKLEEWAKKYGSSFIPPVLSVDMEVAEEDGSVVSKVDLLSGISNRVGGGFGESLKFGSGNKKTIVKFHIYDRSCSPYEGIASALRRSSDGKFYMWDTEDDAETYTAPNENDADAATAHNSSLVPQATGDENSIKIGDQIVAIGIGNGKEALRQYLGSAVPTIQVGANGSLITNIQLQSKTDSLQGTIALQGGTQKLETSLTSNGLSQELLHMPMILFPAQLTMTTMGCPIAVPYQQFFIDFGTGTTIDNCYTVTQVAHSFSPGKFETQWTFCYYDGYGRMINPGKISDVLVSLKNVAAKPQGTAVSAAPRQPTR